MTQTAAIIAIGTEVSSGEIMNSNASWLAARLDSCGIDVILHLAVADDRQSILDALDFASARATHVLTIGGLGPTTDDFTRDVITAWAGLTTSFDEPSWKRIEDRFQQFGRTAPQSNRQQCFFPEGSRILLNSEGSANGFSLRARNTRVTVLPGPPRELQAIWKDHLDEEFHNLGATGTKPRLLTWACLGVPESTLAEQVESIMAGSDLQLGYRASAPMVHVKVWIPKGAEEKSAPFIDKLNKALEPVCVARDGADPLASLKATLSAQRDSLHVTLDDSVTGGLLASRLADLLRPLDIPFSLTSSHRHSDATRHSERSEESSLPRHSERSEESSPPRHSERSEESSPPRHSEPKAKNPLPLPLTLSFTSVNGTPTLTIRTSTQSREHTYPSTQLPAASDALQTTRTRLLLTERALLDVSQLSLV